MIKRENTFVLNGVKSDIIMKVDSKNYNNTVAVLGALNRRPETKGRESPPPCGNGFKTAGLPFDRGHVIALELGGSDDPHNVVPQFRYWQENGEWKQMENHLRHLMLNNALMLVEIGYGRKGTKEGEGLAKKTFAADPLRDWRDPRIPDSFKIRVWSKSEKLLKGIKTDPQFNKTIAELEKYTLNFKKEFNLGVELPQPDRFHYITNGALGIARDLHKLKKQPGSLVSELLQGDLLKETRNELAGYDGVLPTEAMGIQAFSIIAAHQEGPTTTPTEIKTKWQNLKDAKIKVIPEKDVGLKRKAQFENPPKKTKIGHHTN